MNEELFYRCFYDWLCLYAINSRGDHFNDKTAASYRSFLKNAFIVIGDGFENDLNLEKITLAYLLYMDGRDYLKALIYNILLEKSKECDDKEHKRISNSISALNFYWLFLDYVADQEASLISEVQEDASEAHSEVLRKICDETYISDQEKDDDVVVTVFSRNKIRSRCRSRLATQNRGNRNIRYPARLLNQMFPDFFDRQCEEVKFFISQNGDYVLYKDLKELRISKRGSVWVLCKYNGEEVEKRLFVHENNEYEEAKSINKLLDDFHVDHLIPISKAMGELVKENRIPTFLKLTDWINKWPSEKSNKEITRGNEETRQVFIDKYRLDKEPIRSQLYEEMVLINQCVVSLDFADARYNEEKSDHLSEEDIDEALENDLKQHIRDFLLELKKSICD